jgi:hypothetical protein
MVLVSSLPAAIGRPVEKKKGICVSVNKRVRDTSGGGWLGVLWVGRGCCVCEGLLSLLMSIESEVLVKEGEVLEELLDYALQHYDCELLSALRQDLGVPTPDPGMVLQALG